MSTRETPSLLRAVRIDLRRLHAGWLGLAFPQRRRGSHPVAGSWEPATTPGRVAFRCWSLLGIAVVALVYPFALAGFATRFHVRRFDRVAEVLGLLGVVALTAVLWGALAALARLRFSQEGFLAVTAAGVVATASAGLAVLFSRLDGRPVSVLLAYPFGVTAVFLPPVVAALYSPALAAALFPRSELLAEWLLENVATGGLEAYLRETYELEGVAFVAMWFGLAVPVGWALGGVVTLANLLRPTE